MLVKCDVKQSALITKRCVTSQNKLFIRARTLKKYGNYALLIINTFINYISNCYVH